MSSNLPQPPIAKTVPQTITHLRWRLVDPYAWLQDKSDLEVIAYLEAENAYARAVMQPTETLQETLFQEMRGRIKEDDSSAPQRRGEYWYYSRFTSGQQYRLFCRKKAPALVGTTQNVNPVTASRRTKFALAKQSLDKQQVASSPSATRNDNSPNQVSKSWGEAIFVPDKNPNTGAAPGYGPIEQSDWWRQVAEEVLLDENALAEGHSYCRVQTCEPSPDHNLLAYSVDTTGSRLFDLYVKDLRSGVVVAGPIPQVAWTVAWADDSRTLVYTVFDASHRPFKLFRHTLGEEASQDPLIYHEADDAFTMRINRSRSGEYLLLTLNSHSTSEVRYLPATRPGDPLKVIQPRQHWLEYYAEHHGDRFLIRTNDQARNFKLVEAPVSSPGKEHWREILPHREDTLVEGVLAFRHHLVVSGRRQGLKQLRISEPDGVTNVRYVAFPDPVYNFVAETFFFTYNPEFDTDELRFEYDSLVTPASTVDYNLHSAAWVVKKQMEIPSGYDPSLYRSERLFATASDGAQVPISLVYRVGTDIHAGAPLLMEGYGSYGFSSDAYFDAKRLSLLDRGFIFAIAHVRGGSELGRDWYENGRLMHKKNTFTDFISCAEHLVAQGYTSPDRLAIAGISAGGLLISAVLNLRPDLFKAALALVPFTNVITAMLMPDLPLTVIEYEQWGHPDDEQAFEYMLSYSPYENVDARAYPAILVRAGLNDLQVPYWDPTKWVAKLRAHKKGDNLLLLLTNMAAGHGGSSGRYDYLKEAALNYTFLLKMLE